MHSHVGSAFSCGELSYKKIAKKGGVSLKRQELEAVTPDDHIEATLNDERYFRILREQIPKAIRRYNID